MNESNQIAPVRGWPDKDEHAVACQNDQLPHKISLRRLPLYLCCFWLFSLVISPSAITDANLPNVLGEIDAPVVQLDGEEIVKAFSDVRDDAKVQGAAGTIAINEWHADGRFISRCSNGLESGEVTGTWRVENNQRCITIATGLPQRVGKESCGAPFRRGSAYLCFNSDGSGHGIHALSPLKRPSK